MNVLSRCLLSAVLSLPALLLSHCADANHYYILTAEGPAPNGGGVGIGVGPVTIPAYLDRDNLVFQQQGNSLAVAEAHRWAGELDENIAQVLATNLGRRKHSGNIRSYPWVDDHGLSYQIVVDIRQLHGNDEGDAVLDAVWQVYSLPDRRLVSSRNWSGVEALESDGYNALAAAESRLLARLSDQIASSL
ncbi:hypothetical protein HNR46_000213 [Haloferula luteola]|uniref:ABC-type transport auxiliary lipoprotein component domain-containing protein n=1 Tax=Haloferula luteola TaxID=595692 RepID=A0A840UW29_9BACT|nr:PqiC family protein [Haloferula luteola]MBB5349992.1 hypothetical protein [Haloferula luteola]